MWMIGNDKSNQCQALDNHISGYENQEWLKILM